MIPPLNKEAVSSVVERAAAIQQNDPINCNRQQNNDKTNLYVNQNHHNRSQSIKFFTTNSISTSRAANQSCEENTLKETKRTVEVMPALFKNF